MLDYKEAKKGVNKFQDFEFNDITRELLNCLRFTGEEPDGKTTREQLVKAIYKVSFIPMKATGINNIQLTPPYIPPFNDYFDGMIVTFIPTDDNTDQVFVSVGSLDAVSVSNSQAPSTIKKNVPVALIYGNGEFHKLALSDYWKDGFLPDTPIKTDEYTRPESVTRGMYWEDNSGTLYFYTGDEYGDIKVSLTGEEPAGLTYGDHWLDASIMPPVIRTIGELGEDGIYRHGLTPNNAVYARSKERPSTIEAGMFWIDSDDNTWFYDGYDDVVVVTDKCTQPIDLADGDKWVDASAYPYDVNYKGQPSGLGIIYNPFKSEPSDEFKQPNTYWVDCNGKYYMTTSDGEDLPVILNGIPPSGLVDGDRYVDASVIPYRIVVYGEDTTIGNDINDPYKTDEENCDTPEELIGYAGKYWTNKDGQLFVTVDEDGNSLPVSLDGNEPEEMCDNVNYIDASVYPPKVMVFDEATKSWKDEDLTIIKTRLTSIGNFADTNFGITSLDGSKIPNYYREVEYSGFGALINMEMHQNQNDYTGKAELDCLLYEQLKARKTFVNDVNTGLDTEINSISPFIVEPKYTGIYTVNHRRDKDVMYQKCNFTEIIASKIYNDKNSRRIYGLKDYNRVDLSMFQYRDKLSSYRLSETYSIILYDGKVFATGINKTECRFGLFAPDGDIIYEKFTDVTPDPSRTYIRAEIMCNGGIGLLDDECHFTYMVFDKRHKMPSRYVDYGEDVWDIIDGRYIVEKNTNRLILLCPDSTVRYTGIDILKDKSKIVFDYYNVKGMYCLTAEDNKIYDLNRRKIVELESQIDYYFPYLDEIDCGFVRLDFVLSDMLLQAIDEIESFNIVRYVRYKNEIYVIGLKKNEDETVTTFIDKIFVNMNRLVKNVDEIKDISSFGYLTKDIYKLYERK